MKQKFLFSLAFIFATTHFVGITYTANQATQKQVTQGKTDKVAALKEGVRETLKYSLRTAPLKKAADFVATIFPYFSLFALHTLHHMYWDNLPKENAMASAKQDMAKNLFAILIKLLALKKIEDDLTSIKNYYLKDCTAF